MHAAGPTSDPTYSWRGTAHAPPCCSCNHALSTPPPRPAPPRRSCRLQLHLLREPLAGWVKPIRGEAWHKPWRRGQDLRASGGCRVGPVPPGMRRCSGCALQRGQQGLCKLGAGHRRSSPTVPLPRTNHRSVRSLSVLKVRWKAGHKATACVPQVSLPSAAQRGAPRCSRRLRALHIEFPALSPTSSEAG